MKAVNVGQTYIMADFGTKVVVTDIVVRWSSVSKRMTGIITYVDNSTDAIIEESAEAFCVGVRDGVMVLEHEHESAESVRSMALEENANQLEQEAAWERQCENKGLDADEEYRKVYG